MARARKDPWGTLARAGGEGRIALGAWSARRIVTGMTPAESRAILAKASA